MSRSRPRGRAPLALALAALGAAGISGRPPDVDPRPAVAVRVELDDADYREHLRHEFARLARTLEDTVPALLERRFPFVAWRNARSPAETVVVRWQRPPTDLADLEVRMWVTARGARSDSVVAAFEPWAVMTERMDEAGEKTARAVARIWLPALDALLAVNAPRIVDRVLGPLPLRVEVKIRGQELKGIVRVSPQAIRAPPEPAPQPEFRVRAIITDPGPDPDLSTRARGELRFDRCAPNAEATQYVCDLAEVRYRDRAMPTPADTEAVALVRRARFDSTSVHLRSYTPAGVATAAGGAMLPEPR